MKYEGILFDLDGTLIDSAPDLLATLNALLARYQCPPVELSAVRNSISQGSAQLLKIGFKHELPKDMQVLRQEFLDLYQTYNTRCTELFADIAALLSSIETSQTPWAIVTNKPTKATLSIVAHLGLDQRTAAIVCGDTLPIAKPDPSPILLACDRMGVKADNCVYLGDAATDIEAGKAANMATIACAYGYISPEAPAVNTWGADAIALCPADLHALLFETSPLKREEKKRMNDFEKDRQTLLNFPEKFPIKIFGLDDEVFTAAVKDIIANHVDEQDILSWQNKTSSKGNYLAITVHIMARSQLQLDAIYLDLTASDCVKMAL